MNTNDKLQLEEDIKNAENMRQASIASYDKMLTTLSAGGLILSLTIYEKVYSHINPWLLIITWICYLLSLFATLISHHTAHKSCDEQISCNTNKINEKDCSTFWFKFYYCLTKSLNVVSLICFIIGSITFLLFSSQNLINKENLMSNTKLYNGSTCSSSSTQRTTAMDGALTSSMSAQRTLAEGLTSNTVARVNTEKGLTPNTVSMNNTTGTPQNNNNGK